MLISSSTQLSFFLAFDRRSVLQISSPSSRWVIFAFTIDFSCSSIGCLLYTRRFGSPCVWLRCFVRVLIEFLEFFDCDSFFVDESFAKKKKKFAFSVDFVFVGNLCPFLFFFFFSRCFCLLEFVIVCVEITLWIYFANFIRYVEYLGISIWKLSSMAWSSVILWLCNFIFFGAPEEIVYGFVIFGVVVIFYCLYLRRNKGFQQKRKRERTEKEDMQSSNKERLT